MASGPSCQRVGPVRSGMHAQQRLEEAAHMAVEVLSEIARDSAVPASVRVKASVAILERCTT